MASGRLMRSRKSASSAPRGERRRRGVSISARLSSSHSCQPLSVATAVTPIPSVTVEPRANKAAGSFILSVPQFLDLALEAVFLLDRDPLEHLDALLELLDLVAQAYGFRVGERRRRFAHPRPPRVDPRPDHAGGHHDKDDAEDEFESAHFLSLSVSGQFSGGSTRFCRSSRSRSISSETSSPLSVTIRSSTRTRCSSRSVCDAYCAAFSAVSRASISIRFSRCSSHLLRNGWPRTRVIGSPTAMKTIRTLARSSIVQSPALSSAPA